MQNLRNFTYDKAEVNYDLERIVDFFSQNNSTPSISQCFLALLSQNFYLCPSMLINLYSLTTYREIIYHGNLKT